jgi:hypothetical protein
MGMKMCGSKKLDGSGKTCVLKAGFGTDHSGFGKCKFHGGMSPSGKLAAAREETRGTAFYGDPVDVTPGEALLQEVRRTGGHVAYLAAKVAQADLDAKDTGEPLTARVRALRELYAHERRHLTQVCQVALHAGVEERAVRVAERWGDELANVLSAILEDLQLTKEQQARAPDVVGRHLRVMEGGR